ncbi:MAG TPA: glycosyltransferase [Acidimicrobiia bacterium]|jgi:glycosyltransferase involved in cell wall biosynthesis
MTLGMAGVRRSRHDDVVVLSSHSAKLAGGEIAMARVAAAMTRYRPHVLLGEEGPVADLLRRDGVTVEIMPMDDEIRAVGRDEWVDLRSLKHTRRALSYVHARCDRLSEIRPLLVHTNSLKSGFLTGSAARLAGIPVVWHLRDHLSQSYMSRGALVGSSALIRATSSIAIANSQSTRATLPRGVPSVVIQSPIRELPPLRPERHDDADGLTFTVLGRLAPWKGQDLFLRAFARAFPDGPHRALVVGGPLFGESDYAASLERLTRTLGIEERVTMTGHVAEPQQHLDHTDVLVHTSVIPEPFGLVIVEGMATGLPVVAADEGGPPETITDGVDGVLYRMGDEVALATALRRLADDPDERARLGAHARRTAYQYLPEAIARRVEHVYDCVAAGRGSHPRHVVVNGRFKTRPVSGVERFAGNVSTRLETPTRVVVPPTAPFARGLLGHLWEQTVLPLRVPRQALLWNPCNYGPLISHRAVVTVHDVAPMDHPEWFGDGYRMWFSYVVPRLCAHALKVATVSSFTRGRVMERFGLEGDDIEVVPNGCAIERAPRLLEDPDGRPYVLAVGAVDPRKNLPGLQRAMELVRERYPDVELKVTGARPAGVFAASTHEWTSLDTLTGHVTDGELRELYRHARCLVYPSFYEGFGLPPLEAMALGTRAVVSRLPPIEELCGDAAVYIDPYDAYDIARGIEQVLAESADERRRAVAAGVERAEHYSWSAAAREYDRVFSEIWAVGHRD